MSACSSITPANIGRQYYKFHKSTRQAAIKPSKPRICEKWRGIGVYFASTSERSRNLVSRRNQWTTPAAKAAPEAAGQETRTTSWVLPVVTAVVLIAAFCLYYFVYVKAQREYLGNRNFRSLAALGDQLQTMITIHGSILEFYADMSSPKRHGKEPHREKVDFKRFFVVRPEDVRLPAALQEREARKDYVRYLSPAFQLADPASTKATRKRSQAHDTASRRPLVPCSSMPFRKQEIPRITGVRW